MSDEPEKKLPQDKADPVAALNQPSDARFLASVLDHLEEGVYFVDLQRRITLWNRASETITGWSAQAVLGRRCADGILRHCDATGTILCGGDCPLLAAMNDGQTRTTEVFMLRSDGARIPVHVRVSPMRSDDGAISGCVEVFSNDASRLAVLEEMKHLHDAAMLDSLTGLPNRRFLLSRFPRVLEEAQMQSIPVAVLFIDLDHFKSINDTFGHDWGDEVLRIAATTLRGNLRSLDVIARWGGEEFVIVAPNMMAAELTGFSERLRALIERCEIGRPAHSIAVTASIGCTLAGADEGWEAVTARADRLMYESKRSGRNRVTQG